MSRVLVTGGCGFLGSHLVERLVARGDDVTVFDTVPPPADQATAREHARFVEGDIRDGARVADAAAGQDVIYHMAAVVGVDRYLSRPLDVIDINFSGTRTVLDAALRAGARVVHASTSEVFGKNPAVPWRENDDRVLGPTSTDRWTYSSSKALIEHLVFAYARQHGLAAAVVRYFNVYGPRQRPAFLLSRSVHRALNNRPVTVYDQGRQTRCPTFVDDAIEGTVLAGTHPGAVGEVFNIGSMTETTVREVVDLVAKLVGDGPETVEVDTVVALGAHYEDLARRVPDSTKARTVLGWSCRTELADGLARTIEWARANPWWLALPDSGAS
ncbi:NAD-dependent epimerase/dehydratase family protein [Micromonospora sp. PLK6-60]|uniref:NAD-dependent epimerase/dehydratase family protein n=1 Tax=Micromonospora sp. PLK6-60 TaxID=2873383 RepID=UPI001CA61BFE|nr:NAD-dependent epimerase/dehydratase family protein [Micromonospora sp. PLK6-60]MBY8870727.1 NAD-dependent epimerase/dehydratase family protein [Micromonospora sp. PLK6-60]